MNVNKIVLQSSLLLSYIHTSIRRRRQRPMAVRFSRRAADLCLELVSPKSLAVSIQHQTTFYDAPLIKSSILRYNQHHCRDSTGTHCLRSLVVDGKRRREQLKGIFGRRQLLFPKGRKLGNHSSNVMFHLTLYMLRLIPYRLAIVVFKGGVVLLLQHVGQFVEGRFTPFCFSIQLYMSYYYGTKLLASTVVLIIRKASGVARERRRANVPCIVHRTHVGEFRESPKDCF